jgi:hypothetical protein
MHYSERLKNELAEERRELEALRAELRGLRGYLTSAKFHEDPTVQVGDVLRRLEAAEQCARDARHAKPAEQCARDARHAKPAECKGHPAGPFDPMGETVYCDGRCAR